MVCNRCVWSGRRRLDCNANQQKLSLAIPWTDFLDGSLHSWSCVSNCGKNSIYSLVHDHKCRVSKFSTGHGSGRYYDGNMQYGI